MEQEKGSTQTRKGKYLNWNERILIAGFLKAGMSESNIAKELERERRTNTYKPLECPKMATCGDSGLMTRGIIDFYTSPFINNRESLMSQY